MSERAVVTDRLSVLAARLRSDGVRVGVGELLAGHRALAAVDAVVAQGRRTTRCAPRCARGVEDLRLFADAFHAVFGSAMARRPRPASRPAVARDAAARRRSRRAARARRRDRPRRSRVPAAWSPVELLRTKDFAELHATPSARRRSRSCWRARPPRARGGSAGARGPRAGAATARTCARRSARRCATAASRSSGAGAGPRCARARSCSCATCPARWSPTRACCCSTCRPCVAARARVEAFAFGTRLTRITRELAGRDPDVALRPRRRGGAGLVGRHPHRRGAGRAQPRARPAHRPRRGGRGALRRLGPGRARAAGRRDGAPAPLRAPRRVAEPAQGADPATSRSRAG